MDERTERIGRNEALFRSINENLEDLNDSMAPMTGTFELVCECGASDCTEQLRLSPSDYERIRSDGALFVIRVGHSVPDVEDVVWDGDGFEVVRKRPGGPAELARALDERAP